jgi:uncharacterized SAM-binding protein YcdF (DUF218 family)
MPEISMYNSNLCHSTARTWTTLIGLLSQWMTEPFLVLPFFFLLLHGLNVLPRVPIRRFLRMLICTSAIVYLMVLFPPTISLAESLLVRQIPQDAGKVADAVVVLGRGELLAPGRVEVAAKLWEEQRASLIFVSGIWDSPRIVKKLKEKGIPEQFLDGENCSRTTYENAKFTAEILKSQGIRQILLVTDAPHMLRSTLTFQNFGFTVIPAPTPIDLSLNRSIRARLILREYGGLVSYRLKGRLAPSANLKARFIPGLRAERLDQSRTEKRG